MGTCRSGNCDTSNDVHPPVTMVPCGAASTFQWNPSRGSVDAPNQQVLTTESCSAEIGDVVIMWEYVADTCRGRSNLSNQKFNLQNTTSNQFTLSPVQNPTACVTASGSNVLVGACDSDSARWSWTSSGQLQNAGTSSCMDAPDVPAKSAGEVWARPLDTTGTTSAARVAVVLFNGQDTGPNVTVTATLGQLGLDATKPVQIRDLWAHIDLPSTATLSASLAPHSSSMFVVSQ